MPAKRSFSPTDVPTKGDDYHGGARFLRSSPDLVAQGVKSVNLDLTFEEALKLSVALQSCLQAVNRYSRSTSKGKAMGVLLSIKTEGSAISVIEAPVHGKDAP
jgi:hypothetical protein